MIVLAIGGVMFGVALLAMFGGYLLARSEFDEALTRARWEANCWKKRCEQLELQDHVRFVGVHPVREPGGR